MIASGQTALTALLPELNMQKQTGT